MTKVKTTNKGRALTHNEPADPASYFVGNPLNDTRNHLEAVLERVNGICDGYGSPGATADQFAKWTPCLVELDKALRGAIKALAKWEYTVKLEAIKKETKIELVETWDPFGGFGDNALKE